MDLNVMNKVRSYCSFVYTITWVRSDSVLELLWHLIKGLSAKVSLHLNDPSPSNLSLENYILGRDIRCEKTKVITMISSSN